MAGRFALAWYVLRKRFVTSTPPPVGGFPSMDFTDYRNTAYVAAFYI